MSYPSLGSWREMFWISTAGVDIIDLDIEFVIEFREERRGKKAKISRVEAGLLNLDASVETFGPKSSNAFWQHTS